jgi:putative ABC transport system ATP-binding protein
MEANNSIAQGVRPLFRKTKLDFTNEQLRCHSVGRSSETGWVLFDGKVPAKVFLNMIELVNIEKAYEAGASKSFVLRRISMNIREGDFLTIMGPSGAGKSTLLSILGMLDAGWTGEYHLVGEAVHRMKPRDRMELNKRYVGFVFQQYHLLDNLTVAENLDIPLSYRNIRRGERQSLVADTLDRFQIVGKKDLYPHQLSGGQQQLVAVARAVIAKPKLLLADEPTGNLHSSQGKEIMDLFKRLNEEGTTIVQVTHSELNATYGNRIVQLFDGWLKD